MAVEPKMVRKWKRAIRAQMREFNKVSDSLLSFNNKHAADPPFTDAQANQIIACTVFVGVALNLKVPKT
jgi:hypothetical protein